jgi:oxaloacetate decarboxylase alpha subunit
VYTVKVNGQSYAVEVTEGGDVSAITPTAAPSVPAPAAGGGEPVKAPLAGNIFKVHVGVGDTVAAGDVIVILEAMKMETEVRAPHGGTVSAVNVKEGDTVAVGDMLISLG